MDQILKIKRNPNPQQNANILSKLTFWYTLPMFFKETLNEDDIPENLDNCKAYVASNNLETRWKNQKLRDKTSLWLAISRAFGLEFLTLGFILCLDQLVFKLLRALALIQLVKYFSQDGDSEIDLKTAYVYGASLVVLSLLSVFTYNVARNYLLLFGIRIRVACSSLIYKKSLRLSKSVLTDVSVGHITNLLSNDLNRIEKAFFFIHYYWIGAMEIVVVALFLYVLVGFTSTIGIAFMLIWLPVMAFTGKQFSKLRLKTAIKTDERVQLMSEIISAVKAIKMYTWEKPFAKLVDISRRAEAKKIQAINYIWGFIRLAVVLPKIALFLSVIAYVLSGNQLTAVYVFTIVCFYDNIKITLVLNYSYGIMMVTDLQVTVKRIENFLLLDEIKRVSRRDGEPIVHLHEVTARWSKSVSKPTLNKITMTADGNKLVGIVGPVGSGKSSIFQVLLDELPIEGGSTQLRGKISYASQDAWIFSGNIRQNILFGQPMDAERYEKVLRVCALERDLALLPYADQTLVGERGVILSGGQKARVSLARAVYREADIYLLDDPFFAVDIRVGNYIFQECIKTFLGQRCVILITHQLQFLNNFDYIYWLENGSVSKSGTYKEIQLYEATLDDIVAHNRGESSINGVEQKLPEDIKEARPTGSMSKKVYIAYINSGESILLFLGVLAAYVVTQVSFCALDVFVAYWVNEEQKSTQHYEYETSNISYTYIFAGIVVCVILASAFRVFIHFKFTTRVSIKLHNKMFTKAIHTSMNFFHANNSGRILNRFSNDMGIIDEVIPVTASEVFHAFLTTTGCVVIICVTNPWLIVATAALSVICYFVRLVYIRTSQNLTRLEGTARSPVYGHLNETLQGITTVRAYNAELILQQEFDNHIDLHSSVSSLIVGCSRAFCFYTDLLCVVYIAAVVASALLNHSEQYAGTVGLAITQAIGFINVFQWGMLQSTDIENQMTSVERVVEYTKLTPENDREGSLTPTNWPKNGSIQFESLSLRYSCDQPYVLKNINCAIEPTHKIGIVGRTGAGKSSLITSLFQLAKTEGAIYIDGVDITKISTQTVRSMISIIPQDPVLFSGTIRRNLDPFGHYSDLELWAALEEVQLKSTISAMPLGLDHSVSDGGSNFSVGQRQLICLARAIIKKNKILVLDEATASVDVDNDTLIQNAVRKKFTDCTVLTIAHRLNTIMDADKVLVMNAGEIIEYDHPHLLLQNKSGMFYLMVQETGNSMANALSKIAENSYRHGTTKL